MMKPHSSRIALHVAGLDTDGVHTGARLSRQVDSGELIRLRRGVYVATRDWLEARPWERPALAVAATALVAPRTVFCGTSALLLHGVPLLTPPRRVHVRTLRRSSVRLTRQTPMTGRTAPERVVRRLGLPPAAVERLQGIPTQRHEPVIPPHHTRDDLREHTTQNPVSAAETLIPRVRLPRTASPVCSGPDDGYLVEPLELAAVDTVTRLPAPDAVVVLDAVMARLVADGLPEGDARARLVSWFGHVRAPRRRTLLSERTDFADPRAESPGESLSRWRIHELGFVAPELQTTVSLDTGRARLDFEWPDVGVVGEFDGRLKYGADPSLSGREAADAVYAEKLREDAIRRTGRDVVRWGWAQLQEPDQLAQRLSRAGVPRRP